MSSPYRTSASRKSVARASVVAAGLLATALVVVPTAAWSASTYADFAATLAYDSNQSNAEAASDREEGFVLSGSAQLNHRILLSRTVGMQFSGRLEVDGNERYGDLSRAGLGGEVSINFKPFVGYTMPWFGLSASAMVSEHADSDLRDGVHGNITATVGKRFTDRINGRIGYNFDWRSASGGSAFDTQGHGLFAAADYAASKRLFLYARYDARAGDVVSTATPTRKVINAAEVIERDDAFGISSVPRGLLGPGPIGPAPGPLGSFARFAYRIDAISHQGRVGANYALGDDMSLDLSARYRTTLGDGDNDYQSLAVQGAFLYRWR